LQFRVVSSLEGQPLDALSVPYSRGDAVSNTPADVRHR
jgi:hypothetical protein